MIFKKYNTALMVFGSIVTLNSTSIADEYSKEAYLEGFGSYSPSSQHTNTTFDHVEQRFHHSKEPLEKKIEDLTALLEEEKLRTDKLRNELSMLAASTRNERERFGQIKNDSAVIQENNDLKSQLCFWIQSHGDLSNKVEDLEGKLQRRGQNSVTLSNLSERYEATQDELAKLLEENETYRSNIQRSENEQRHLDNKLKMQLHTLADNKVKFRQLEEKLKDSQAYSETLQRKLTGTSSEKDKLQEQVTTLKAFVAILEQRDEGVKSELFTKEAELETLQEKYSSLENRMEEVVSQFGDKLNQQHQKVTSLDCSLKEALANVDYEKNQNSQLLEQLVQARNHINHANEQAALKDAHINNLKSKLDEEVALSSQYCCDMEDMQAYVASHQYHEADLEMEIDELYTIIEDEIKKSKNLELQLNESIAKSYQSEAIIDSKNEEIDKLRAEMHYTNSATQGQTKHLQEELENLQKELVCKEAELSELLAANNEKSLEKMESRERLDYLTNKLQMTQELVKEQQLLIDEKDEMITNALSRVNEVTKSSSYKVQEVENRLVIQEDEKNVLRNQNNELIDALALEKTQVKELRRLLSTSESFSKEVQTALDARDEEFERLNHSLSQVKEEYHFQIQNLQSILAVESANKEKLEQKLIDSTKSFDEQALSIENFSEELEILTKALEDEKEHSEHLKNRLHVAFENLQNRSEEQKEVEALLLIRSEELAALKLTNESLIADLHIHKNLLSEERENQSNTNFALEVAKRELEALSNQFTKGVNETETLVKDTKIALKHESEKSRKLARNLEKSNTELEYQREQTNKLTADLAVLESLTKDYENRLKGAYCKIDQSESEISLIEQNYKIQIDDIYSELYKEKEKSQNYQEQMAQLYASNQSMSQQLKDKLLETEGMYHDYRKRLEIKYKDYDQIKRTYTALQSELAGKVQQVKDFKRVYEEKIARLQENLDATLALNKKKDKDTQELLSQLAEYQEKSDVAIKELQLAEKSLASKEEELAKVNDNFKKMKQSVAMRIKTCKVDDHHMRQLKEKIRHAEKQLQQAQTELAHKQKERERQSLRRVGRRNEEITEVEPRRTRKRGC